VFKLKNGLKNLMLTPLCSCLNHRQKINFFQSGNIPNSKPSLTESAHFNPFHQAAKKVSRGLILFYQATFSFFLGGNCRYYPSCSHYALEAFERHGFWRAFWLTGARLLSCHPFSRREFFDPVPLKKEIYE